MLSMCVLELVHVRYFTLGKRHEADKIIGDVMHAPDFAWPMGKKERKKERKKKEGDLLGPSKKILTGRWHYCPS